MDLLAKQNEALSRKYQDSSTQKAQQSTSTATTPQQQPNGNNPAQNQAVPPNQALNNADSAQPNEQQSHNSGIHNDDGSSPIPEGQADLKQFPDNSQRLGAYGDKQNPAPNNSGDVVSNAPTQAKPEPKTETTGDNGGGQLAVWESYSAFGGEAWGSVCPTPSISLGGCDGRLCITAKGSKVEMLLVNIGKRGQYAKVHVISGNCKGITGFMEQAGLRFL